MEKWFGKTAIVTGASAGIGEAIVKDFAKHGINVIALARRMEKLEALQEELKEAKGKILVNNAAVGISSAILNGDDDDVDDKIMSTVNTNFVGLVRMTRKAYKLMVKANDYSILINIESVVSHIVPFTPFDTNVYSGTKFAVRSVTETLRHELIKNENLKVRVCVTVETEIFGAGGWTEESAKDFLMKYEMPALKSSDVSQTVMFMLMLPYTVDITEMIVKVVGEKF
ncbi:hypothetical protein PVAND_008023 [Polypedilum vanderplanki]|uniref:Uncharacterized protein n=1 Tax=Polypedilum vanderplanki TaxID=319348 RepID=A0A9J6C8H4_POLVA|nr:hypothetical protein PVAND_008023 [Polypedilum vanderplanki]